MSGLSRDTSHILSIALLYMFCASASIASDDVEMLSALGKSLIQGRDMIPNWFYSEMPPCNWTAVDCKGLEVHGLNLPCKSSLLELPFPSSFGELKNLREREGQQTVSVAGARLDAECYMWTMRESTSV